MSANALSGNPTGNSLILFPLAAIDVIGLEPDTLGSVICPAGPIPPDDDPPSSFLLKM